MGWNTVSVLLPPSPMCSVLRINSFMLDFIRFPLPYFLSDWIQELLCLPPPLPVFHLLSPRLPPSTFHLTPIHRYPHHHVLPRVILPSLMSISNTLLLSSILLLLIVHTNSFLVSYLYFFMRLPRSVSTIPTQLPSSTSRGVYPREYYPVTLPLHALGRTTPPHHLV